jgi:hypothetical protein
LVHEPRFKLEIWFESSLENKKKRKIEMKKKRGTT